MRHLVSRLASLSPIITDICQISGIPSVSLGVLHSGEVAYTASFGYADVENKIPSDNETAFVLGSLSKAPTAALLSSLVDEGLLSWDASLTSLLPDFRRSDLYGEITVADLLAHRTGLAALDSLWLASENIPFLNKSQAVEILNNAPAVRPFRTHFLYNNFAYEILGQLVEKLSNTSFAGALRNRLTGPLNLSQTYYTDETRDNEARPYAALEDGSVVRIRPALAGEDVLMGPAGGIRSSVSDLLTLYKAFIDGAREDMTFQSSQLHSTGPSSHPIKHARELLQGHIGLPSHSLREHSYAFGWARAQLPAILAPGDDGKDELSPVIGVGAPSRLALYHGGSIPGYNTYNALFPETDSAVVVLSNSLSLNGGVRWIGELVVEALFDNLDNAADYRKLAKESADANVHRMTAINKALVDETSVSEPTRPLGLYVGRYLNAAGNFFIDIEHSSDGSDIYVSYMGRRADTFRLLPYKEDSFYFSLTHNECMRLSRYTDFPKEYYILKFGIDEQDSTVSKLWWRHELELPEPGEMFRRTTDGPENESHAVGSFGMMKEAVLSIARQFRLF